MSPDSSSRELKPCRVTYSHRLRPNTNKGLVDSRGKTSKAPAIITSKAACGLRMSESCSTLVCTAEGQDSTQSSGRRDERPASARPRPQRDHAPMRRRATRACPDIRGLRHDPVHPYSPYTRWMDSRAAAAQATRPGQPAPPQLLTLASGPRLHSRGGE
jgi:hypothetical protein